MVNTTSGVSASDFEAGIQTAIKAMLMSPSFVFRIVPSQTGVIKTLDNYELATRLSYFLWNSTPDDELLNLAKAGTLKNADVLRPPDPTYVVECKSKTHDRHFCYALVWPGWFEK